MRLPESRPHPGITLSDMEDKENARTAAVRRGNLVSQTAGSRRAELDVLRPVIPAANGLPALWICR